MKKFSTLLLCAVVATGLATAQSVNANDQNIALDGYDVVAYFKSDEPTKGTSDFTHSHEGVIYQFVNKANMKDFKKNPDRYTPKFGGFCAFGLAKAGKKFPVDPTSYKIIDDELYLFFVGPIRGKVTNTQELWNQAESELLPLAEKTWSSIE